MSTLKILQSFETWARERRPLALVTVCRTNGSTYSKSGHQILISDHGEYEGLVSGGCLEHDLAEHARDTIRTGMATLVTYDMREETDALFGLGVGCDGLIELLVQPLTAEQNYQPFRAMADCHRTVTGGQYALVIASESPQLPLGACRISAPQDETTVVPMDAASILATLAAPGDASLPMTVTENIPGADTSTLLHARIAPLPRMLIAGAGADAAPLTRMATELGWLVTVADHRHAYFERGDFDACRKLHLESPTELATATRLDQYSAAIVMSHHQQSDQSYIELLAGTTIPYIGLLGPPARRDRILAATELAGTPAGKRLNSPAGLDLGANSPEGIALEILAEIYQQRSAGT